MVWLVAIGQHLGDSFDVVIGAVLIGLSLWWSIRHNRRNPEGEIEEALRSD